MQITSTGIQFYLLVELNGWQIAVELMKIKNHPSHIWEWLTNIQMFVYTSTKNYFEKVDI